MRCLLDEVRTFFEQKPPIRKPAPPPLGNLPTPQKNTLCSFHFARARFLFLLMKRVFFCGVLPSKHSGRWRGCPLFDFSKEKRNSPQTPLPPFLFSNGTGTETGGTTGLLRYTHKIFLSLCQTNGSESFLGYIIFSIIILSILNRFFISSEVWFKNSQVNK